MSLKNSTMGLFSTNIYVANSECVCARARVRGGYGAENLGEGDESGGKYMGQEQGKRKAESIRDRSKERGRRKVYGTGASKEEGGKYTGQEQGKRKAESIRDRSKERGKVDSRRNGEKFSTLHTYNLLYVIQGGGGSKLRQFS